LRSTVVKLHY